MKNKIKVMTVFGTRPEAIKMAPLVKELKKNENIETNVCVTGQHRDMLDQVLKIFDIQTDNDLNIMSEGQSLVSITVKVLEGLSKVLKKINPDIVLVHGDTTTTFAGSLAAFYAKIKVGHVEAGLRTFDRYYPYPEEMNRKLTGSIANLHFAPTKSNKLNLTREGVEEDTIYTTGNTVIDALNTTVYEQYSFHDETLRQIDFTGSKVITITAHRRENLGEPLENICCAFNDIVNNYDDIQLVFPVHPNPSVGNTVRRILENNPKVHLIHPIGVQDMHNLMNKSYLVATDSGGLQEEAPSLGKPVVVLRNETERQEAVDSGTVRLAGTKYDSIINAVRELIEDEVQYNEMARSINPYGDGVASKRIVDALLYEFGMKEIKPKEFKVENDIDC